MSPAPAAILGGGAAGTLAALHLLESGIPHVTLIERAHRPGRGVAYSTARPEHLLNVHARRMSALADDPGHFARWFAAHGGGPEDFAPRMLYGDYLGELVAAARDRLRIIHDEAVDVRPGGAVVLAGGDEVPADIAILAPGNFKPATPGGIDPAALGPCWIGDPWAGDFIAGLAPEDTVLLIGTGLTAVDVVLTLGARGFGGQIIALSRRGLLPRAHGAHEEAVTPAADLPLTCTALLRRIRNRAAETGWRAAVHELRPVTQALWMQAEVAERRRFLRHLRPWWDVHRHRIAPAIGTTIAAMQEAGTLRAEAGKLVSAVREGEGALVTYRPRGAAKPEVLRVGRIVNCTGPDIAITRSGDPLIAALLAAGTVRPDPCRIGLDVDPGCAVIDAEGRTSANLYAIGPITRGTFWECVAIPDIRVQAKAIARQIALRGA